MSVDLSDSKAKLLTQKEAMTTMNTVAVGGVPGLRVTVKSNKKGEISRFYTLRLTINGKRTQQGVGSVTALSINQARMKALDILESSKAGLETRILTRKINLATHIPLTVEELFRSWQAAQVQRKRWKDPEKTTRDDLARFLKLIPENLRQSSPEKLSPQDIADAILPHWENIHESCLRTCARLSEAYDWGLRNCRISGKNPAQFKNGLLGDLMPVYRGGPKHLGALPVSLVPDFFYSLMNSSNFLPTSGLFIAYSILTTARPGSILNSTWDEIDYELGLQRIPRERMKIQGLA